ncbi:S-layer homology domain-containing protein [Syntrophomonas wolfei]|nr:S-layer homology domain-containing protein [Syntrophomonas wolfei]
MKKKRRKILAYGILLLFMLSISGAAWAAPADTTSTGGKSIEARTLSLFKDVSAGDGNLIYINFLVKKSFIAGFPDGGFHPSEGLSRAQAATVIVKAAGLNSDNKETLFKDVSEEHWAAAYITAAAEAGYLKGYPDGSYRPEDKLSRAEGISLILRLSRQKDDAELPVLKDLDSKHWAANSAAIGLAAGMVGLSSDQNQFLPDADFSRGDLSRALAVLLTTDPDLSRKALNGSLEIKKGEVKINGQIASGTVSIQAGDMIATSASAEAQLNYPDGSGFLVKENTSFTVKETQGREYIKKDGSPGIAVDWLLVDLKKGNVFGALADNPNVQKAAEKKNAAAGERLLAGLSNGLELIAANDKGLPWYKTADSKKVKVKVDMPYGVAAVRGSFWNNSVSDDGCSTSLLEGELDLIAGGQTQSLLPGQSSGAGSSNPLPAPPTPMTAAQVNAWVQQASWLQNVAQTMQAQQAAWQAPPGITQPNQPPPAIPQPTLPSILNVLNQALIQVQQAAGITNPVQLNVAASSSSGYNTGGSSSGGGGGGSQQPGTWRLEDVATTVYNNQTLALTRKLHITPPAEVPQDSYYEVSMKSGGMFYSLGINKIGNPIFHLAKASDDPSRLIAAFQDNSGNRYGFFSLNGSGSSGTLTRLATRTISGKIELQSPSGPIAAPAGGLNIIITITGRSVGGYYYNSQSVTMPAGVSSMDYILEVPENSSSNSYIIHFAVEDSSHSNPFFSTRIFDVDVSKGNASVENIILQPAVYIHGKLSLPDVNTSNTPVSGSIAAIPASGSDGSSLRIYRINFAIEKNKKDFDFHLPVKPGADYYLYYELYNSNNEYEHSQKFYRFGYYSSSGTVGTVPAEDIYTSLVGATAISVNSCVSDINLDVKTGYGYLISGYIILPEAAPNSDINLWLWVHPQSGPAAAISAGIYKSFSHDEKSQAYYLNVPGPGNYILSDGHGTSGFTNPPLYRLDPVAVTVYSADVFQDLNLVSSGIIPGGPGGDITGLDPAMVTGPALLVKGKVYGLLSPSCTAEVAALVRLNECCHFKSADGQWYELNDSGNGLIATDASAIPPIGKIIDCPVLTASPTSFPQSDTGRSIKVSAPSGSALWTASDDSVRAILTNDREGLVMTEGLVISCSPIKPDTIEDENATIPIPDAIPRSKYILTLYKESGGAKILLGAAKFTITNPI